MKLKKLAILSLGAIFGLSLASCDKALDSKEEKSILLKIKMFHRLSKIIIII